MSDRLDNSHSGSDSFGSGTGNGSASSTHSYHNGGVEGDSFATWYEDNLAGEFAGTEGDESNVLDLSQAGAAHTINVTTAPDGTLSGTVEFLDENGAPVGWGHFGGVDAIIPSEDLTAHYYAEGDLEVTGYHGEGQPPKVSIDHLIGPEAEEPEGEPQGSGSGGTGGSGSGGTKGSGSGGTGGSGSGGTKGSGSGGTRGSGSGGTKGSGSGGTGGSGSGGTKGSGSGGTGGSGSAGTKGSGSGGTSGSGTGGTKGSGSGGTRGSGSGGTKGSGSGGTGGSGSGGTKGSGSGNTAESANLPPYTPHDDDVSLDDVMSIMTINVDENGSDGTGQGSASGTASEFI